MPTGNDKSNGAACSAGNANPSRDRQGVGRAYLNIFRVPESTSGATMARIGAAHCPEYANRIVERQATC